MLLSWTPLELQRRIVDDAIHGRDLHLLAALDAIYLATLLQIFLVPPGAQPGQRSGAAHGVANAGRRSGTALPSLGKMRIYLVKYFLTFLGNFLDALGPLAIFIGGG